MSTNRNGQQGHIDKVRELLGAMEVGEQREVDRIMDELTRLRESELFREMGSVTRQLHEALTSLQLDVSVSESAVQMMPDAKEHLDYVITKTEEAAHRTLGAVEASMPVAESIRVRAAELRVEWDRFHRKELAAEEFRALARDTSEFCGALDEQAGTINDKLGEVLMAQDFQDVTGQVIRRVIDLVQEVEGNLVEFIRMRGARQAPTAARADDDSRGNGPRVGDAKRDAYVNGQDDVDDLLSSLGF